MSATSINPKDPKLAESLQNWKKHYEKRLGPCQLFYDSGDVPTYFLRSPLLKEGNHPQLYYKDADRDFLILTHGLSDSPWYVHFIAEEFFKSGLNVMMPLLPGHGLVDPDKAMEDSQLSVKWKDELDNALIAAEVFGKRISLGGFSTGGALSYNLLLRETSRITGGLFLFSGALNIGNFIQFLSELSIIGTFIKIKDGKIEGIGPDPYKYGTFPQYGGVELSEIDNENEDLEKGRKIPHPIFAAHSVHDDTAKLKGITNLLKKHAELGMAYLIGQDVKHAEVPLKTDVPVDLTLARKDYVPPLANPQFRPMMDNALEFYKKHVASDDRS